MIKLIDSLQLLENTDIVVAFFFHDEVSGRSLPATAGGWEKFFNESWVENLFSETDFSGKAGQINILDVRNFKPYKLLCAVGLGSPHQADVKNLSLGLTKALIALSKQKKNQISAVIPSRFCEKSSLSATILSLSIAVSAGTYTFSKYRAGSESKYPEIRLYIAGYRQDAFLEQAVLTMPGILIHVKNLINDSPSVTTPDYLANLISQYLGTGKTVSVTVLNHEQIRSLGMGGLEAVSRGSPGGSRLVKISYDGVGKHHVGLIGKGVTFDSGGLSIKSSTAMESMKMDLSGAITMFGVVDFIRKVGLPVKITALLPLTENLVSAESVKPGDIVKIYGGKSVEVRNTDAEGRLILADSLSYLTETVKPDLIIDYATLTGACMVALGEEVAGVFANCETESQLFLDSASRVGEQMWRLPLVEGYREELNSAFADYRNVASSKYGGAITAALFLSLFIPAGFPWIHVDIAGPAFDEKGKNQKEAGATGFGLVTLVEFLLRISNL
jgi:leucyl aminopeptidase